MAKDRALVTGANRGIGLAIVERLAREGHPTLLCARDLSAGEAEAVRLRGQGLDVTALALDVARPASIAAAVAAARKIGPVGILVNNAGVLSAGNLLDMPQADIDDALAVHVAGPLALVRALAPDMAARGRGRIVNMSSGWGAFAQGLGGPGPYGFTKAALNALTVALARDLGPKVKVNAMSPGWVRTRMGGAGAPRTTEQGADTAYWLATLPDDGPTGGFFQDRKPIAW
ncbi:MAG: SDR family NAD(P)-dependent oxidoreductase [Hyphomicrobiales bacterium]|nr:SDR family NAD(P)-dependent oxidoreductase [Hyphomicrobiales bacterium]